VVRGEIRPQGLEAGLVSRQHAVAGRLDDGLGDEVLAVLEVAVETAVREPGELHELRDAHAVDALLPHGAGSRLDDARADALLVAIAVPHGMIFIISSGVLSSAS